IKDTLDPNVEFVSASDGGSETSGVVNWTLSNVAAGTEGVVTLTVKVLPGALSSKGGPGKVVNGGDNATVKVGNDNEYTLNEVENPVDEPTPEAPHKKETAPYTGNGELGGVKVGDEITYEISYKNYMPTKEDVVINDTLDANVEYVSSTGGGSYDDAAHKVTWTLSDVAAGTEGTVTLTVKVLEGALTSEGGTGEVVNGGSTATVKIGNASEVELEEVKNPVPEEPHKKETSPYEGNGVLGAVKVGDEITYEISYKNYKSTAADIKIKDTLDPNVEFVSASDGGLETSGVVNWTITGVAAGKEGKVTLTVKILKGALNSEGGPGKVINNGDTATVKVGNDNEFTLDTVENPVPENPHKMETLPYVGNGKLGGVNVGDEVTYEISYKNYKNKVADIKIKDTLDPNVEFVSASNGGTENSGVVNWTITGVEAGKEGTVTLTVKVLEGALEKNSGPGKVVNDGTKASVQVGNDPEYNLDTVENPVPKTSEKKEVTPYSGLGELGPVKVGDEITYELSYKNYKDVAATVVINDVLDSNVKFKSASDGGTCAGADSTTEGGGTVTWTLTNVAEGKEGTVTLTVEVLEGALKDATHNGPGKVVNKGETATVKVGNDNEYTLNTVENPVPEDPHKKEISPYKGNGVLGAVKVGDEITYEISYKNYKKVAADVVIKDTLDSNVEFVSASDNGKETSGVVNWTLKDVAAGTEGTVSLTVKVLEGALDSKSGPGKVVNDGTKASVKVGNDPEFKLDTVENPVPEVPTKKETVPYQGTGELGGVKVGDEITYEISYKNYKDTAADIKIKDTLDANVEFVSATDGGSETRGVVNWTIPSVTAGTEGTVSLTVKVLEGALDSKSGPGKVVNGGDTASVQVGNDNEYTLNEVVNPVPEKPTKRQISPYEGTGKLGEIKAGDEITYEITYVNYKMTATDIEISDTLDKNLEFVSASDGGKLVNGTVKWTIKAVPAAGTDSVTITLKVLPSALKENGGPGKVENGGPSSEVKVGNDNVYTLDLVENPVIESSKPDEPEPEVKPDDPEKPSKPKKHKKAVEEPEKPKDSKVTKTPDAKKTSVKTGDSAQVLPIIIVMAISLIGIMVMVMIMMIRRRRR
nr:DUF11 domain-containing protein [Eubacterium sp.]